MMRIKDLTLHDISERKVYRYVDEENQEITAEDISCEIKENTGYYLISGEVQLKDGTKYPAILGISSDDAGEMFEYHFLTSEGWVASSDDVCSFLGKAKEQIFPFKYHLTCRILGDIHIANQY